MLLEEVHKDYSTKIMRRVFNVLKLNLNYRVEKQCTDVLLTKSIHMIVAKRFFQHWRSLAGKRMGLELLAVTMKKLQVASLFKKVRHMQEYDQSAANHVDLLKEFLTLQKTFKAMQRYTRRKDLLEERRI